MGTEGTEGSGQWVPR